MTRAARASAAPIRAIELFSCAGGMAAGFRRAGIHFDLAFDRDADACASYAHNLGHAPIQMDVHDLSRMTRGQAMPPGLAPAVASSVREWFNASRVRPIGFQPSTNEKT